MTRFKTRGEAIKTLRKKAGLSQEELASRLETTKQTIYKYESGIVTNIPSDKIEMMAKIFSVSPAVIMGWDENTTSPIYTAAAGEERINDGYPTEECSFALEDDQFLFKIEGRSMEPTLLDGDLVVVAAQNVLDYSRQLALVKVNGEEQTIKRVEIKDNGLLLIGDNIDVYPPRFYTESEVKSLPVKIDGVVVKLVREIK